MKFECAVKWLFRCESISELTAQYRQNNTKKDNKCCVVPVQLPNIETKFKF